MSGCRWPLLAADVEGGSLCPRQCSCSFIVMEARLKTGLWIRALIRRCDLAAVAVAVVARGDGDSGAVLLKLNGGGEGCTVLAQARGPDGELVWMRATGPQ